MDNGSTGITPVMNVGNGGFGGGDGWGGMIWLFAILAMMNGGFGNWGNNGFANAIGYENLATSREVQNGFDNQNSMANQREILSAVNSGTAQAVAATNQTFHDSLAATQNLYNELQRDVAANAVTLANLQAHQSSCCCDIKSQIAQANYDGAMRDAATNANFTAQIQSVKDMIAQDKIEALQNQVNALQMQNQLANVVRYPSNTFYAVPSPCFNGCGCNGNI